MFKHEPVRRRERGGGLTELSIARQRERSRFRVGAEGNVDHAGGKVVSGVWNADQRGLQQVGT